MVVRLRFAALVTAACAAIHPAAAESVPLDIPATAPASQAAQAAPNVLPAQPAAAYAAGPTAAPDATAAHTADFHDVVVQPESLHALALAEANSGPPEPVDSLPVLPEGAAARAAAAALLREPAGDGELGLEYQLSQRDADSFLNRLTSRIKQLVEQAMTYLGTPYRRGGNSRRGVDCSGLVGAVYGEQGLEMPRTAAEQFGEGVPVAHGDLRPGDLVFFRDTYKHGISHVGIYLGEGRFIHAAGRRQGVIVSELDGSYYRSRYAGARRLATQTADARLGDRPAGVAGAAEGSGDQSKMDGSAAATSTPSVALRNR